MCLFYSYFIFNFAFLNICFLTLMEIYNGVPRYEKQNEYTQLC